MSEAPLPESVARFRTELLQKEPGRHYRGWAHFAFTSLGSLVVMAFAAVAFAASFGLKGREGWVGRAEPARGA